MRHVLSTLSWLAFLATWHVNAAPSNPTVTLSAGARARSRTTFVGRFLPSFDQEVFLGIKYADQPPRFTRSDLKTVYLSNDSSAGPLPSPSATVIYNATRYGYECPGYGSDTTKLLGKGLIQISEDCLNLNIIRPRREAGNKRLLPVMVWIFGGGWQQGATADPRYNMSYIIQQAAANNKPILGVSINYRLAAFGFLDSKEVRASGGTNLGLLDQRVALRWIKKNIAAFGGDPNKVTIWGESAGAYSVGAHLVANRGNHEGLFRAAILNSGNAVGPPWNGTDWHQPMYDRIVSKAGCANSLDTLQCLREVPFKSLYAVAYEGLEWFATVDGQFIAEEPQVSITRGRIARVPILLGTNTDEGTSFGVTGVDTDEECIEQLTASKRWVLTREQATKLLTYYPNDPVIGCPYGWGNVTWPEKGLMYKRYSSMAGDLCMTAPRRLLAQAMAEANKAVYSYRWDVAALNTSSTIGVQHFAEIPFVFANPDQDFTPLGEDPARLQLAALAARIWASFVADLDPNGHGAPMIPKFDPANNADGTPVTEIPKWPRYASTTHQSNPANFVFRLPMGDSYVEKDDYRAEGIAYINSIQR
ncbi:carboxylesterase family protein [Parathielavia appendiculata]|uniref:Carboxylic ester hydrolase n=1 Tax=Parathielavia appendiculata TaxID=2587402 RepID=A0AAN6TSY0_9PEZI|nr:carboxylesterase family protein [Parathielavia appendiculata]